MSPEQIAGDSSKLDTCSDVYSLGTVCYEFLCGDLPHNIRMRSIPEAAPIIVEQEPTRLTSVDVPYRGDIETIVSMALSKDKDHRHQSAAEFAADIRRHLNDEPILACPATTLYQLPKSAKRNKPLVAGASIALIALVVGAAFASWQAVVATRQRTLVQQREADAVAVRASEQEQRQLAEQRTDELKTVTGFQQSLLGQIDAETMGRGIFANIREGIREEMQSEGADPAQVEAARASLDGLVARVNATDRALKVVDENVLVRAVETIHEEFADQPVTGAALQQTVADTYYEMGLYQSAMP